ncbi:MAG: hypothetical protein KBH29_04250 [Lutibacter sp.]|nr:hypothetical protein [Lutibacter sp.]
MKNILYSMLSGFIFTALFISCEDVNDQFDELDSLTGITNLAAYNYSLVDADYATIATAAGDAAASIKTNKYFTTAFPASEYMPYLLKTKYPYGDLGSTAMVTYAFNEGRPAYVDAFSNANAYTLAKGDYASSGSAITGYYPDATPSTYLPTILAANISAPVDGQIALAKYTQYTETPVVTTTSNYLVEDNFNFGATAGDLVTATANWTAHSGAAPLVGYGTSSLSMLGYPSSSFGGAALISGSGSEDVNKTFTAQNTGTVYFSSLVNLSAVSTGAYFFHVYEYGTGNFRARIGAKDDGSGKILFGISTSASNPIYGTTAYELNKTYLVVGSYNIDSGVSNLYVLSAAAATMPSTPEVSDTGTAGTVINAVAIRQSFGGPTGTVDGVRVTKTWADLFVNNVVEKITGAKNSKEVYYKYTSGSWAAAQGIYALTTEDYDSMGTGAGQPGQFDNFSSSILPQNYIPTLLAKLYPYAQSGNTIAISYKYYSGGLQTVVDEYLFKDGKWSNPSTIINKTEQFVFSNSGWVFDPTVKITMEKADYKLMVDYVLATPSIAVFAHPTYKNEEYYYGFGDRYSNVNFRLSYRNPYFTGADVQPATIDPELNNLATDTEKVALMWTRLQEGMGIFLQLRYPNAVPTVGGLEVQYHATTNVYYPTGISSGNEYHTYIFKCTAAASGSTPPQFEFISESKVN